MSPEMVLHNQSPTSPVFRYRLESEINRPNRQMDGYQREQGLQFPTSHVTTRMIRLAESLMENSSDATGYANVLLAHFNSNPFSYTLQPPLLGSNRPVDEFLFDSRQGFCEHYAAAFVTMMRVAGYPARVVIGYLGGELNPRANQITVRQSDAHAWTEYWSENLGWVRVDPTAAIAPERIDNSIDLENSLAGNNMVQFVGSELGALANLLREARWFADLAKLKWDRWVVGFDHDRQQTLLSNLGLKDIALHILGAIAFLVSVTLLGIVAVILYRREKSRSDPVQKIWNQYCRKLARQGLVRQPFEGPMDFLRRARAKFPQADNQLTLITENYMTLRYGVPDNTGRLDVLETAIRKLNLKMSG